MTSADPGPDADHGWIVDGTTEPAEAEGRYDAWAAGYDDDLAAWSYRAPETAVRLLLERSPDPGSVLDVGCGTGLVGRALRAAGFGGRLHGLDISSSSLLIAEQSGAYATVEQADLQRALPVDTDSVAALACVGVMTYLPDTEAVWREMARVVRPGGLVVLTQRDELWASRGCGEIADRLASEGVWAPLEVRPAQPYLPGSGEMGDVRVTYLVAEVR